MVVQIAAARESDNVTRIKQVSCRTLRIGFIEVTSKRRVQDVARGMDAGIMGLRGSPVKVGVKGSF